MLNKKPIMLVLGCSWTDTNFLSVLKHLPDDRRGGWPMWDSYVQNKLEERDGIRYERINLASSGKSNQHIQRDFFRAVSMYGDRIKYVFVGGTKFNRYMGPHDNASINIDTHNFFTNRKYARAKIESWNERAPGVRDYWQWHIENELFTAQGIKANVERNTGYMASILHTCEGMGISLFWAQLLKPMTDYNLYKQLIALGITPKSDWNPSENFWKARYTSNVLQAFLESLHFNVLEKHRRQFSGLPFVGPDAKIFENVKQDQKHLFIDRTAKDPNERDGHPNAYGQECIGNYIWEQYCENMDKV
jgi:hypothetical protein